MPPKKRKAVEDPPRNKGLQTICKKALSLQREQAENLQGEDRKAAIQNMLSWLKANSKDGRKNAADNDEALSIYKTIDDEDERTDFISRFYKSRNSDNNMKWAKTLKANVNSHESSKFSYTENYFNRTVIIIKDNDIDNNNRNKQK